MTKENSRLIICSILAIFLITIVLDIVPYKYPASWVEQIFTYNIEWIIPIGIALWAFVTGMIIFWFGKSSEYYMGLTYKEIYNAIIKKRKFVDEIEKISICFIAILLLASFYEWKITFMTCILFQFLSMSIMYYDIKTSVSEEGIGKAICNNTNDIVIVFERKEEKGIFERQSEVCIEENIIFVKAIEGINKEDIDSRKKLINMLKKTRLYKMSGGQAIAMGRFLTEKIFETAISGEIKFEIIQELFLDNEECAIDLQRGILFSLVENIDYCMNEQIHNLIDCIDGEQRKKGNEVRGDYVAWYIAVFIFLLSFEQYEKNRIFLHDIAQYLKTEAGYFPQKTWAKDILNNWHLLCELKDCDPIKNIDRLMEIVEGY